MVYTPYDWTQNLQSRREYVEDQLREGSPVVGTSYSGGVLLVTVRRTQDKVFEIYDRLAFSGIGRQADLENLRLAAIDFAHREGFTLSPEDVTAQRVVGVSLSPMLKRGFGDFMSHPLITRALFAELGRIPDEDIFYTLDFDGEFMLRHRFAGVAGSKRAEEDIATALEAGWSDNQTLEQALSLALNAWAQGRIRSQAKDEGTGEETHLTKPADILRDELVHGTIEAAVLERDSGRENTFRRLRDEDTRAALEEATTK